MADSTMPGSLIWSPKDCSDVGVTPVLPNNTNVARVYGLKTDNQTLIRSCCPGQDIQTYGSCWQYCATNSSLSEFGECLNAGTNLTSPPEGSFCQGNATGKIQQKVVSSGLPRISAPGTGKVLLLLCLVAGLITPGSASIIHSLNPEGALSHRADTSTCQFVPDRHYTQTGASQKVTSDAGGFSSSGQMIDTGITNNNRTINGTSAAAATYDAFFDKLRLSLDANPQL